MDYYYTISEENIVRIFYSKLKLPGNPPVVLQPRHPDGRDWEDRSEAEAWAQAEVDKANGKT